MDSGGLGAVRRVGRWQSVGRLARWIGVHGENEWLRPVQNFVDKEKAEIAVVMFGANDRIDMRDDKLGYLHFRTDIWRDTYAKRTDRILDAMVGAGLKIIWCGNPIATPIQFRDFPAASLHVSDNCADRVGDCQ